MRKQLFARAAAGLLAGLAAALLACGCSAAPPEEPAGVGGSTVRAPVESGELQFAAPQKGDAVAVIETGAGTIRVLLYPRQAPAAVENFTALAGEGYYNGTVFHRVVKDFVIQGGDATGTGHSGASVWGRPFATERSDSLRHYAGAVCMAAADGEPDTHLSQFYIVVCPPGNLDEQALQAMAGAGVRQAVADAYAAAGGAPWLDNTDTVFGQVIGGMDVADAIAAGALDDAGSPRAPVEILAVTVESYAG